jgi:hypothetical protein
LLTVVIEYLWVVADVVIVIGVETHLEVPVIACWKRWVLHASNVDIPLTTGGVVAHRGQTCRVDHSRRIVENGILEPSDTSGEGKQQIAEIASVVWVGVDVPVELIGKWEVLMRGGEEVRVGTWHKTGGAADHKVTVFAVTAIIGLAQGINVVGQVYAMQFEGHLFTLLIDGVIDSIRVDDIIEIKSNAGTWTSTYHLVDSRVGLGIDP